MLQDTITKIEGRLQNAGSLPEGSRAELLKLLEQLRTEIAHLSQTHEEQARSIEGFTEVSTYEATRAAKNPESLKHSIGGLEASVGEFEKSHPHLVAVVNRLADMLSNMGI